MREDGNTFEPPTAEEVSEATLLRDRLESGCGDPGPDAERTLVLLSAASDSPPFDDVAVRRLRRELVAAASRRWRHGVLYAALQVAAALLVAALLAVGRAPAPPSAALLAEREALAREAVLRVQATASSATDEAVGVSRSTLASLTRARTAELFLSIDSDRLSLRVGEELSGSAGSSGASGLSGISATPTPGGAS